MFRSTAIVLIICFAAICTAQLTFTPQWGKRGISQGSQVQPGQSESGCKTSVDSLMLIYKLIQVRNFPLSLYNLMLSMYLNNLTFF